MQTLVGHTSFDTAYHVTDYPYGRLKCNIWFWLEHSHTKGYRFCSRTQNPKNGVLNAPKKSTYSKIAGVLYLDENNHVDWAGLSEYSSAEEALAFVQKYPQADLTTLKDFSGLKARYCKAILTSGKYPYQFNGVSRDLSEVEREEYQVDYKGWVKVNLTCQGAELNSTSTESLA